MSKYDNERKKLGLTPVGSTSSASPTKSKYADEREALTNPLKKAQNDRKGYEEGMKKSRLMEIETNQAKQSKYQQERQEMEKIGMDFASQNAKPLSLSQKGLQHIVDTQPVKPTLPSYGERIRDRLSDFPAVLQPLVAPIAALEQAPFMVSSRQGLGTTRGQEDQYEFGKGAQLAGDVLNTAGAVTFSGSGGGGLYNAAGKLINKYAPNLANTAGGRLGTLGFKGIAEGVPAGVGQELAMNPDASAKELATSGAIGAGFGLLPALGRGLKEAIRAPREAVEGNLRSSIDTLSKYRDTLPQSVRRTTRAETVPASVESRSSSQPVLSDEGEQLYKQAVDHVVQTNKPSASSLQSQFKIGYQQAARMLDRMEAEGIVSAYDGSTPRVVLKRSVSESVPESVVSSSNAVETLPTARQAETPLTPSNKARGNLSTQLESERLSPELQAEISKRDNTYTPRTHAGALDEANNIVKDLPDAEARFLANKDVSDTHVATGYRLMQELDRMGEYERAANISSKLMEDLTKAGQSASAARIIQRLSPEGQLMHLQRVAKEAGKEVSMADSQAYKKLAQDVQQGSLSGKETSDFMKTLQKLKNGESVSDDEMKYARSILEDAQRFVKTGKKPRAITPELNNVRTRDKVLSYFEQQAVEARKAWDAKRNIGFAQRLSEPDVVLLAKMAAHKVAKGVVNFADFTEYLVKEFGELARPYAQEVYDRARSLVRSTSKGISEGKLKEATEAFERLSKGKSDAEKVADKFLKDNPVSARDIEKINSIVKDLNDLKGVKATDAEIQMQKIINNYTKSSLNDKLNTLRYVAMLANTSTQAVNAVSGPIMATTGYVADVFGSMLDIAMKTMLNKPRTTTLYGSNPLSFLANYFKNLKTGVKAGWHGAEPSGIQSQSDIRGLTFKSDINPAKWLERGLGAVSKGADYATYKTVFDSEIRKQAFLSAKNNKIKGTDRKSYIDQFVANPPAEAVEIADRIGKNTTFQRQDTLGGQLANYLHGAPKLFPKVEKYAKPAISTITPFVRTPINIASTALTMTPAGIIKGLWQLARNGSDEIVRREAIRNLGLGLTGSAGLGVLGYELSDLGIITGANDSGDKNVDAVREQAGQGKYRFNTSALQRYLSALIGGEGQEAARKAAQYQEGDKQFDYNKLQPLAFPLAAGASFQENKDKSLGNRLAAVGTDATGSLLGMSALTGIQNITQKPLQGSSGEKSLQLPINIIESYLKSFSPSSLAQEARRQDPVQRKTAYAEGIVKDVGDYFKSRIPGQSSSLQPRITSLGDTAMNPKGVTGQYLNPFRSEAANFNRAAVIISDLIDRTGDTGIAPSAPDKKVSGKDRNGNSVSIAIEPKRYTKYQEDIGKEITRQIIGIGSMSDADKVEKIKDIYSKVKEKYRNEIKREFGIVVKR